MIPCGDNRSDKSLKASAKQRIEMLEYTRNDILDKSFSNISICDYEIKAGKYLPTYELLVGLKKEYPNKNFYFCIGSDLVNEVGTWDDGDKLLDENNFVILTREGYMYLGENLPKKHLFLYINIYGSSTLIRSRISEKSNSERKYNIHGLTSKSCIEFITKNYLYLS